MAFGRKEIRIPPQNVEAEQALLGSIMISPGSIVEVTETLSPDAFYSDRNKTIYKVMLELYAKGIAIDILSLTSRLTEKELIEQVGGNTYLAELVNMVPSAANVIHYAELIQKKYILRRLIEASEHVCGIGYDEESELAEILDQAEKKIYEVTHLSTNSKYIDLRNVLGEAWERIDRLHKTKGELRGVPTGFKKLDALLSGLQKSDLIILAARPSVGKTSLVLDIARQTAVKHKVPVAIFSLEMSSTQLVDRMLAAESMVNSWHLRTGGLTKETEFNQIRDALGRLSDAPIYIDDQPGNNVMKMRSVLRKLKSDKGVGLVVVDYLQLMAPSSKQNDSFYQQVTEISRSLKNMAREFDVPVLALSQLSRAVEQRGGKPRLSDLRDSGSIEQDADIVIFIHRENNDEGGGRKEASEILIEKHRNGPTGKVDLYVDKDRSTFCEMETGGGFEDFAGATQ